MAKPILFIRMNLDPFLIPEHVDSLRKAFQENGISNEYHSLVAVDPSLDEKFKLEIISTEQCTPEKLEELNRLMRESVRLIEKASQPVAVVTAVTAVELNPNEIERMKNSQPVILRKGKVTI